MVVFSKNSTLPLFIEIFFWQGIAISEFIEKIYSSIGEGKRFLQSANIFWAVENCYHWIKESFRKLQLFLKVLAGRWWLQFIWRERMHKDTMWREMADVYRIVNLSLSQITQHTTIMTSKIHKWTNKQTKLI